MPMYLLCQILPTLLLVPSFEVCEERVYDMEFRVERDTTLMAEYTMMIERKPHGCWSFTLPWYSSW